MSDIFKYYLIPFGSVLIATISLLLNSVNIPSWVYWVFIIYLVTAIILAIVKPIRALRNKIILMRSLARFRHYYQPIVVSFIFKIKEILRYDKETNLINLINKKNDYLNNCTDVHITDPHRIISEWLLSTETMLKNNEKNLIQVVKDIGDIIQHYNSYCCGYQIYFEKQINDGNVKEKKIIVLKQNWNTLRNNHDRFIHEWIDLEAAISNTYGEKVASNYFEPLKTLE